MATASATIIGEGADVTVLRFDSGISGPAIILGANDQSIHVRDLSIVSAGIPASTIGLSIALITDSGSTPTQSDITGVTIRGSDGYAKTNSFGTLFSLSGVSNVTFINDNFIGTSGGAAFATSSGPTCVKLVGTANSPPVQFNFLAVQANYCSAGIYYGKYVQGVSVSSSNFVGNHYGILIDSGQIGNDQLAVSTSQFNNGAADIIVKSLIDGVTITGNDFYSITSGGVGIALNQVDSYAIVGNTFIGINSTDQNAITIGGGLGGTVTGNQFKGPSFANCILLDKGSSGANVQSNSYVGSCVHVKNLGGSANTVGGGSP
jgi:nitrous oxidase accessory protein NosD